MRCCASSATSEMCWQTSRESAVGYVSMVHKLCVDLTLTGIMCDCGAEIRFEHDRVATYLPDQKAPFFHIIALW